MWAKQIGGHGKNTTELRRELDRLAEEFPGLMPQEARGYLEELADDPREIIIDAGRVVE